MLPWLEPEMPEQEPSRQVKTEVNGVGKIKMKQLCLGVFLGGMELTSAWLMVEACKLILTSEEFGKQGIHYRHYWKLIMQTYK